MRQTIIGILLALIALLALSTHLVAQNSPQYSTYSSLASSNTSAGIAGGSSSGNVSKLSIKALLPAGSKARIYARLMTWYGTTSHENVGYSSTDATQVQKQVQDMISRGIDGVIVNWQGSADFTNQAALLVMSETASQNGAFEFAIEEDAKAVTDCAASATCDLDARMIKDLTYIVNTYAGANGYMKHQNSPVIFLTGMEAYKVNWNAVRSSIPGNPVLVFRSAA